MRRYLMILGGLALWASPLFAQDYIDLEQERLQRSADADVANDTAATPPAESGSAFGELYYQIQLLQQEVRELRGQLEEQNHQLQQLKQQSLERYLDLDRRLNGSGDSRATSPDSAAGGQPIREQPGEAQAYRSAYSLVRSQQFVEAVTAFKQFLQDFPDGKYAPNAHYWLGELYLVSAPPDLESARREFTLLIEQFPDTAKLPDALYKLGKIYFDKGNSARAREHFDRVINEFGNSSSSAVKLSRDFLIENY